MMHLRHSHLRWRIAGQYQFRGQANLSELRIFANLKLLFFIIIFCFICYKFSRKPSFFIVEAPVKFKVSASLLTQHNFYREAKQQLLRGVLAF